jgi:hypothetical protein
VKKLALVTLLLSSALAWAGSNPNPAQYTINVHVTRSRIAEGHAYQLLKVIIDGKKYEVACFSSPYALLALGDYKAKLVKDEHRESYDSLQKYEFLFPNN